VQISFEYHGLPLEIEDRAFTRAFDAMKFDEVLQYVSFPKVRVIRTDSVQRPVKIRQSVQASGVGQGCQDMAFFFEWLAKAKGVRHIINIQVDDWQKPSHSEESIMSVFKSITVDNMDWQRLDLDPLVMCNKLRKIDLYWSGNNAILRAWSEPEGLPRLPLLAKVSLHVPSIDEVGGIPILLLLFEAIRMKLIDSTVDA
jgi:hypothetical protein